MVGSLRRWRQVVLLCDGGMGVAIGALGRLLRGMILEVMDDGGGGWTTSEIGLALAVAGGRWDGVEVACIAVVVLAFLFMGWAVNV